MKSVICFGEVLIDFLRSSVNITKEGALNEFTQFPGGAPANAAVAVAKLGGKSMFAGQVGNDHFGHFLIDSLSQYGVDTTHTAVHPTAKTALAFVFLDKQGERSFTFYRDNTADMVFEVQQVSDTWFEDSPVFHFCSNTLTGSSIAHVTEEIVAKASSAGALISFDVNLRHNLWQGGRANEDIVNSLVLQSHMIKFAKDELDYLAQGNKQLYIERCFESGVKAILVTDGAKKVEYHYTPRSHVSIVPPAVKAIDTTGGGDAFIGGVLFGLGQHSSPFHCLQNPEYMAALVTFATHCGAHTVSKQGAFPALPTFDDVNHIWSTVQ
jgi:fructokinase